MPSFRRATVVVLAVLAGCQSSGPPPPPPETLTGAAIASAIPPPWGEAGLGICGLAYWNGHLYAGTTAGLLEILNGEVVALQRWGRPTRWGVPNFVVEGPHGDGRTGGIWVWHGDTLWLSRLDSAGWHHTPIPWPPEGFTRGDMMGGFKVVPGATATWLLGGGRAWQWDREDARLLLTTVPSPPAHHSRVLGVADGAPGVAFFLGDRDPFLQKAPIEEVAVQGGGGWVCKRVGGVVASDVVLAGSATFLRTELGALLEWTGEELTNVAAPGACEAIAVDDVGRLVASFIGAGIQRREGDTWTPLFTPPADDSPNTKAWACLAATEGAVAYARDGLHREGVIFIWDGAIVRRVDPRAGPTTPPPAPALPD